MWSPTFKVLCSFSVPLPNTLDFTRHYKTIIIITFSPSLTFLCLSEGVLCKEVPAGRREESEIFYLGFCKIGGFTAKLVCLERSLLSSVKLPDEPRSASVSGDSSRPFSYSLTVYLLWKLSVLFRCALPPHHPPSPPRLPCLMAHKALERVWRAPFNGEGFSLEVTGLLPRSVRWRGAFTELVTWKFDLAVAT